MQEVNLSSREFAKLERMHLIEGTLEKESEMFYLDDTHKDIIKVYKHYLEEEYMHEKIKAIHNLLRYNSEYNFQELLLPKGILKVNSEVRGVIYPKIVGYTSRTYLSILYNPIEVKIAILKRIGNLLQKIKNTSKLTNAAFADVHVDNFIINGIPLDNVYNVNNLQITACDTDSMRIYDSPGITGYYLYDSDKLSDVSKYELDDYGFIVPSSNTDIYCYSMIILDMISKSEFVYNLGIDEYYRYLDYLEKLGLDVSLINAFRSLYEDDIDNISPLPYLDSLKSIPNGTSLTEFYLKRSKK